MRPSRRRPRCVIARIARSAAQGILRSMATRRRRRPRPPGSARGRPAAPARRWRWRWRWTDLPPAAWIALAIGAIVAADVAYQVAKKPTELLALVAPTRPKPPGGTWAEYRALFEAHSTELVRPETLAALAQVESAGDPLARTYWRWQWSWNPLELWAPASSAVGLLQITDGTFEQARALCIHDHDVATAGPWSDPRGCWFNGLYFRTVPSHAIEMTAAMLHRSVARIVAERRPPRASEAELRRVAAVIHLCGPERGAAFARRGFRTVPGERCGDHDLGEYVARVETLAAAFARMGP
jgi:hypothetical protein